MKLKLTAICLTALTLAACGGQGSGSSGTDDDSTTGDGDGDSTGDGDGDVAGDGDGDVTGDGDGDIVGDGDAPAVEIDVHQDIPGKETAVIVTTEEGATISWTLLDSPAGSGLKSEDLKGANDEEVTFVPQRSGTYELAVEVTLDGKTTKKSVIIEIKGYEIPFSRLHVTPTEAGTSSSHVAAVVDSGGLNPRDVGCAWTASEEVEGAASIGDRRQGTYVRMPNSVEESAIVLSRIYSEDANHLHLEFATSDTSCEEEPPEVLSTGTPVTDGNLPVRISPNGERFIETSVEESEFVIFTWGPGEAEAHIIVVGVPDTTPQFAWMNDTSFAASMGEDAGEDGFIYSLLAVPDKTAGAAEAEEIMNCAGIDPENTILPSGQFLFRGTDLFVLSHLGGLYHLVPTEGMYDCAADSENNTLLTIGEEIPSQFDVSADGTLVTFQDAMASAIYTLVADGASEAIRISPLDGTQHRYPSFALGGEQVVWTSSYLYEEPAEGEEPFAEGNVTRILRANPDGSHPFVVFQSEVPVEEATEVTTGTRVGSSCSFGLGLGGGAGSISALGLAMAAVLRRRRARRNCTSA